MFSSPCHQITLQLPCLSSLSPFWQLGVFFLWGTSIILGCTLASSLVVEEDSEVVLLTQTQMHRTITITNKFEWKLYLPYDLDIIIARLQSVIKVIRVSFSFASSGSHRMSPQIDYSSNFASIWTCEQLRCRHVVVGCL